MPQYEKHDLTVKLESVQWCINFTHTLTNEDQSNASFIHS